MIVPRRKFLTGFASLLAAPAIVPIASLMPVKPVLIVPAAVSGWSFEVSNGQMRWATLMVTGTDAFGNKITERLPGDGVAVSMTSFRSIDKVTYDYDV